MIDFSEKRVLVTGGAGFIGSALVWELNRRGCTRIVIADFLGESDKWRNLTPLKFEDYLEADDLFARIEQRALGRFDLVLHMGACSATTERDAAYLARNNYEYTKELTSFALNMSARFVYASSAATYGDGSAGMSDDASLANLHSLRPLNMYGYSKQLFDLYAAKRGILDKIVGLKFFNIFGPNENHKGEMRSLVNKAYSQVLETGEIRLFKSYRSDYADGEQRRDFLYVKDAVAMTLHLAGDGAARPVCTTSGAVRRAPGSISRTRCSRHSTSHRRFASSTCRKSYERSISTSRRLTSRGCVPLDMMRRSRRWQTQSRITCGIIW